MIASRIGRAAHCFALIARRACAFLVPAWRRTPSRRQNDIVATPVRVPGRRLHLRQHRAGVHRHRLQRGGGLRHHGAARDRRERALPGGGRPGGLRDRARNASHPPPRDAGAAGRPVHPEPSDRDPRHLRTQDGRPDGHGARSAALPDGADAFRRRFPLRRLHPEHPRGAGRGGEHRRCEPDRHLLAGDLPARCARRSPPPWC